MLIDVVVAEAVAARAPPLHIDERSHVGAILKAIHAAPFDALLTAGSLKRTCGSRDHNVASEFKLAVGCSIKQYLLSFRLYVAAACLEQTTCSVAEIARRVGFTSPQRFYAGFARQYGVTPAKYFDRRRNTSSTAGGAPEIGEANAGL